MFYKFKGIAFQIARIASPNIFHQIPENEIELIYTTAFYRALDRYTFGKCKFSSYLVNVIRFEMIAFWRENIQPRYGENYIYSLDFPTIDTQNCYLSDVVGDSSSVQEIFSHISFSEFLSTYEKIKEFIPPTLKKIFEFIYLGFNVREISEKLRVPYSRVVRDLKVFKEIYAEVASSVYATAKIPDGYIPKKRYSRFSKRKKKIS